MVYCEDLFYGSRFALRTAGSFAGTACTGAVLTVSTAGGSAILFIFRDFHYDGCNNSGKNNTDNDCSPVEGEVMQHGQILLSSGLHQDNFFDSFFVKVVASLYFRKNSI